MTNPQDLSLEELKIAFLKIWKCYFYRPSKTSKGRIAGFGLLGDWRNTEAEAWASVKIPDSMLFGPGGAMDELAAHYASMDFLIDILSGLPFEMKPSTALRRAIQIATVIHHQSKG